MKAVQDFNYKVALASGLKHLQSGKLRQAEEQFRYLVQKFPSADGGYRGLARVQVELADRAAALGTLRDGAAALSRAGERALAIDLLREATGLDPLDLSAHRRLAAALALAGDVNAAAQEYVRFADAEIAAGDPDRAKLEVSYALETLGEIPALHELARSVGLQLRTVRRLAPEPESGPSPEPSAASAYEPPAVTAEPETAPPAEPLADVPWRRPPDPEHDPRLAAAAAWAASRPASLQDRTGTAMPSDTEQQTASAQSWQEPHATPSWQEPARTANTPSWEAPPAAPAPEPPRADPLELEARASALIASRDADAGPAGVEAARALADAGMVNAASDLLLQLVASGIAVHDAERELVRVAHALGRSEIASEREQLLRRVSESG